MNKLAASIHSPGRLTVLAALLAGLASPVLAASPNVVISQVYGAGGNGSGATGATYKHDFIELFNRGNTSIDIGGWSVQYASSTGNSWSNRTAIPANTILAPGQYYLIREAAGAGGAPGVVDTPADLIPATTIPMGGSSGKVALVSNTTPLTGSTPSGGALVDLVGYGNGSNAEGGSPTGNIGNQTSAQRRGNGCTDTDVNGDDFEVLAVAPRTSGTPLNVCGGANDAPIVTSCPASLVRPHGELVSAILNASDKDNRVTSAAITSSLVAGIRLEEFSASPDRDAAAGVKLVVDSSTAAGNHAVVVSFTNDAGKSLACTVTVRSAGNQSIPAIQGPGAASPFQGTAQTTEGVITAKVGSGYFVQDPDGDNDPATSDAIFVYGATDGVAGERVRVTGLVTEYLPSGSNSYTELTESVSTVLGAGQTVHATNISFPGGDLERYEGMLVRITNPLTVNQNKYLGTRGELTLSNGRLEVPTNRYRPGTPEAIAMAAANAANVITLDDGIFTAPPVIPYIGVDGTVRAGDTVTGLEGVLDFGALGAGGAGFKLQPTVAPEFSRTNPRLGVPSLPAGVKVASANVLNFFTTFTDLTDVEGKTTLGCTIGSGAPSAGNCRGADNLQEFVRQRDKIVKSLVALNADVVGLMEIQNNGDVAVQYLVDSINAVLGSAVYAVVPKPASTGTDAIRVAMIYKPAALTLVGTALSDGDRVNNRPPMAQTFKAANGAKFSVIVNHLKAKAGCPSGSGVDTDRGDGQGCFNATRVLQAKRLAEYFIPLVKSTAGDDDVLVIGDMNAHGFEDPIAALTDAGLVNELERFVRPQGLVYSYVFDGESGYLDHALTTPSLSAQVAGAAEWHNNADEPETIDYNFDTGNGNTPKTQDLFANDAFRASDHDPVLVSLNLTPTWIDASASFSVVRSALALNRATGQYGGSFQFTNKTGAAITGPFHVKIGGLPADVTLANASGSHNGLPYITAGTGSIAPGATVTVNLLFNNPKRVAFNYSAAIIAGTF
ncbi:ExeM/NucH family extracellular endonuclease [Massilia sp. IC2-477]|uniref:ExeM/NucH family extracellular endonuclease n=1 Tax=Massilia sp. IC2-477 TaxID=2887198 RepID=UPI001D11B2D7|nr:ExeM/NucH family extracellular endonuclease [Massilia sp. IC2-477]MCC2954642.1 ExeM/NucH family extracellular endonuclease [Massilia sp. IC2-477]